MKGFKLESLKWDISHKLVGGESFNMIVLSIFIILLLAIIDILAIVRFIKNLIRSELRKDYTISILILLLPYVFLIIYDLIFKVNTFMIFSLFTSLCVYLLIYYIVGKGEVYEFINVLISSLISVSVFNIMFTGLKASLTWSLIDGMLLGFVVELAYTFYKNFNYVKDKVECDT